MPSHRKEGARPRGHRAPRSLRRAERSAPGDLPDVPRIRERILRMLVVTPQFTASAGLVIAAMLAIDMPHAALSYGPNPQINTCAAVSCGSTKPGTGKVTTSDPGIKLKRPHPSVAAHPTPSATPHQAPVPTPSPSSPVGPQVTLEYRTLHQLHSGSGFMAMIIVKSHPALKTAWSLSFAFPDAKISHVWGATWHQNPGANGGIVTGQPWPWPGQNSVSSRVVIFATGTPSVPSSCTFNGSTCVFS